MAENLKPCPFCGQPPTARRWSRDAKNGDYVIECVSKKCDVRPSTDYRSKRLAAIRLWNTRKGEK